MIKRTFILAFAMIGGSVPALLAESSYERELLQLKAQRDKALAAAVAPIEQRYREELKKLLQRATQGNDLNAAIKIKGEFGRPSGIPNDAVQFNGKWYRVYPEQMTWSEARKKCKSMNGDLASVADESTHNFIKSLAPEVVLWLGGADEKSEGVWRWESGVLMQFSAWHKGEPSGGRQENHLHVSNGAWRDASEDQRHGFVCEWNAN